jgi:hypothetical protein
MARLILTMAVIVGVVLATAGILRFQNTTDEFTITIDKKELQEKTGKAVEKTEKAGGTILDRTGEALHKAAEGLRRSPSDEHASTKTPATGNDSARQPDGSMNPPDNREHHSGRKPVD